MKVVLLVDALNEAVRLDRHPNILDLIDTACDLPDAVHWLFTSRQGKHLAVLPSTRMVMPDDSIKNMADVQACVTAVPAGPTVTGP